MNEKEKMLAGKIYDPTDEELTKLRTKAHRLSQRYNTLFEDDELRDIVIDELIPNKGKEFIFKDLSTLTMVYLQVLEKIAMQTLTLQCLMYAL